MSSGRVLRSAKNKIIKLENDQMKGIKEETDLNQNVVVSRKRNVIERKTLAVGPAEKKHGLRNTVEAERSPKMFDVKVKLEKLDPSVLRQGRAIVAKTVTSAKVNDAKASITTSKKIMANSVKAPLSIPKIVTANNSNGSTIVKASRFTELANIATGSRILKGPVPTSTIHAANNTNGSIIAKPSFPTLTSAMSSDARVSQLSTLVKKRRLSENMYNKLVALEDSAGYVSNADSFVCGICFTAVLPRTGVTIRNCLHQFCAECCVQAIVHSETALVQCPAIIGVEKCCAVFQDREIRSLLNTQQMELHETKSLTEAEGASENSFHCRKPNCRAWCELADKFVAVFKCLICGSDNCINCKAIHSGKTCLEYQRNLNGDSKTQAYFTQLKEKGLGMNCPKCNIIVTKVEGCDAIKCSMCKTEICWATKGPRWGPLGRGDISGGCKCELFAGRPCHPKCRNCH